MASSSRGESGPVGGLAGCGSATRLATMDSVKPRMEKQRSMEASLERGIAAKPITALVVCEGRARRCKKKKGGKAWREDFLGAAQHLRPVSGWPGTCPAADARASLFLPPPSPERCSPTTPLLPVAKQARAGEHLIIHRRFLQRSWRTMSTAFGSPRATWATGKHYLGG